MIFFHLYFDHQAIVVLIGENLLKKMIRSFGIVAKSILVVVITPSHKQFNVGIPILSVYNSSHFSTKICMWYVYHK